MIQEIKAVEDKAIGTEVVLDVCALTGLYDIQIETLDDHHCE